MNLFRSYCCLIVLCLFVPDASAQEQQPVSVHLQTEFGQPFVVRWNGKKFESSASGYLVLPQVGSGNQSFTVFFNGMEKAEFRYTIAVGNDTKGYTLRQAIDNSWRLFDMVEWATIEGVYIEPAPKEVIAEKPPASIPAPVSEDRPVEKIPVRSVETPAVKTGSPVVARPREPLTTGISKIFDKSGSTGIDQVYVLTNGVRSDTIALFIPVLTEEMPKTGTNPAAVLKHTNQTIDMVAQNREWLATRRRYLFMSN
ncbi:hypothetical protein GWC95_15265 [Sediminibacterium roseum]|uniref:Uncharacterized protein n=1 Tax=Sediminibacterium roseum TaxID=1978412 RepID=A0ABW9ZVU2_9BACT|nr:hypothetical protein [Sediminibacterium roseum]NCI51287.1 hypothetical protein [Sediminibacterium roseum]